jgi:cold-inducible RNA-binding protein
VGKRLYIGNIPFSVTEDELRDAFAQHGTVTGVDVITDRETGRPRGFAFVEMEDPVAADAAITALDGTDFGGRNLKVNEAQERRGGGGRR